MKINILYGPPGTGKTHTLIDILDKEVRDGTPINQIAFVSFSRKATYEAQFRIKEHFNCLDADLRNMRTIHSMAFRATRASAEQMMNPAKYRDFGVKSGFSLKGYYSVDEGFQSRDDDFIGIEQLYRNNHRYCEKILDNIDHQRFVLYMQMYRKYKSTFKYLDFTDLLDLYIQNHLTEDVKVAIIDEAQDLTTLQWRVVLQAYQNVERLYIAGDDDQAIFQWAGADIQAFLQLKGDSTILEYSYRLPQMLVHYAAGITKLIKFRVDKSYHGDAEREGIFQYISEISELDYYNHESWYLLARNNFLLKQYIAQCMLQGVRFKVKGTDYLTKTDISQIKSDKDLSDWEPEKLQYVNRLVSNGRLDDEPIINISTIHAVKGGEAENVVIMTDVSRGVQRQLEWDEDSEHRNFYVGITRARHRVYVVLPSTKYNYPYLG